MARRGYRAARAGTTPPARKAAMRVRCQMPEVGVGNRHCIPARSVMRRNDIGVEIGQLGIVVLVWPLFWILAKQGQKTV